MSSFRVLLIAVILLIVVIAGEIYYLFVIKKPITEIPTPVVKTQSISPTKIVSVSPTSPLATPTSTQDYAFNPAVFETIIEMSKSDKNTGILNTLTEGKITAIDKNGEDGFLTYDYRIQMKDKAEKYPRNVFYITEYLKDKVMIVENDGSSTKIIPVDDLKVGDIIRVEIQWDITKDIQQSITSLKISRLK